MSAYAKPGCTVVRATSQTHRGREIERCPVCAEVLWYPTDALGRVVGRCDACHATYTATTITVAPLPEWLAAADLDRRRTQAEGRLMAFLASARTHRYTMMQLAARLACSTETARRALHILCSRGLVTRTITHSNKPRLFQIAPAAFKAAA